MISIIHDIYVVYIIVWRIRAAMVRENRKVIFLFGRNGNKNVRDAVRVIHYSSSKIYIYIVAVATFLSQSVSIYARLFLYIYIYILLREYVLFPSKSK